MTDLVKSLKIGNNSYGIKDEKATPYLTDTDKKVLLFYDKYRDKAADPRIFIDEEGRALEKNIDLTKTSEITLEAMEELGTMTASDSACIVFADYGDSCFYSNDKGTSWSSVTLPSSGQYETACYGNGKFVALARATKKGIYSTNGTSWTEVETPSAQVWSDIAYGNGKFVAISSNSSNKTMYSSDGVSWTQGTMPSSSSWKRIAYGNGRFIAVSQTNKAAYSIDGINWTASTLPQSSQWCCIAYSNGKFVASSLNSNSIAVSTDGSSWESLSLNLSFPCYTIGTVFGFLFFTQSGGLFSKDLVNFTKESCSFSSISDPHYAITSDNIYFYLSPSDKALNILDFTTITSTSNSIQAAECFFAKGNGKFVVTVTQPMGTSNCPVYSSNDGLTWTEIFTGHNTSYQHVIHGLSNFVALGNDDSVIYSSDGVTWSDATLPSVSLGVVTHLAYGAGIFAVVSYNGSAAMYSTDDGVTWSAATTPSSNWHAHADIDGKLFIFSYGTDYMYSTDGINWTSATLPVACSYIAAGDGKVIVASDTTAAYSTDGINWSTSTLSYSARGGAYENGLFVFSHPNGYVSCSTDGVTWSTKSSPVTYAFEPVIVDKWIYIYSEDGLFYSADMGNTWTHCDVDFPEMVIPTALGGADGIFIGSRCHMMDGVGVIDTFKPSLKNYRYVSYNKSEVDEALANKQNTLLDAFGHLPPNILAQLPLGDGYYIPVVTKMDGECYITWEVFEKNE